MDSKKSVYDIVTEKVLDNLSKGIAVWRKPWQSVSGIRPMGYTGHEYRGGNAFLFSMFAHAVPVYVTFNQIKKAGAKIKADKNKAYYPLFYWQFVKTTNKSTGKEETFPMLRYYLVWNIEDVEGMELPKKIQAKIDAAKINVDKVMPAHDAAQAIVNASPVAGIVNEITGDRAYYQIASDKIIVPKREQFNTIEEFYATLFHEMGHATGAPSRLNRKGITDFDFFGSHQYSAEELVAEMTAAFLCSESGIETTIENSSAYIQGWFRKLKDEPKLFWIAANQAQKAADLLLNRSNVWEEEEKIAA